MLYGEKYRAILKLNKIYALKNHIKQTSDNMSKVHLVSLVYSLTGYSSNYKLLAHFIRCEHFTSLHEKAI